MPLLSNLNGYWKLDESSGNASDSSGFGNTLTNNNTVTYSAGIINNGANFGTPNTNRNLTVASTLGITTGSYSFNCWVKMLTEITTGVQGFLALNDGTNHLLSFFEYQFNSGTRRVIINRRKQGVSDNIVSSNITLGTTVFHQLAATYDGATLTLYVDGTSVGTLATSGVGTGGGADNFYIGSEDANSFARAIVDEVGVWSRALTSGEITSLYNGGAGLSYPFGGTGNFLMFMN